MKRITIFIIILLLIIVGAGMYYLGMTKSANLENIANSEKSENLNSDNTTESEKNEEVNKDNNIESKENERIVLYFGNEIETIPGSRWVGDMEDDLEKYKTKYYNYENGEYKGETLEGELEETYEACYRVKNVSKVAISEKYDAIPRKREKINNVPLKLKEAINNAGEANNEPKDNREIIDVESVDLDGDGKNEYIVVYKKQTDKGFSGIDLVEYSVEDDFYIVSENLVNITGENNYDYEYNKLDEWFTYSLENIEYIDIDNDGLMEILILLPGWEGGGVSIYKYKNGIVYGDLNFEASTLP